MKTKDMRGWLQSGVLIIVVAGCTGDDADQSPALDGEPAEIIEELRIDGHAADLVPVGAVAVAEDGTIAITQPQEGLIRFFDAAGAFLDALGGRGEGPGEFASMSSVGWVADTLWIYDPRQQRVTLASPEGAFVRTVRMPGRAQPAPEDSSRIPDFPWAFPVGLSPDGSVYASLQPALGRDLPDGFRDATAVGRIARDGTVERILARIPIGDVQFNTPQGSVMLPFPNGAADAMAPTGDRVAFAYTSLDGAESDSFRVTVIHVEGDTVFSRRYPFEGARIPSEVADSAITATAERVRDAELAEALRRNASIPPVYPPIDGLIIGRDGTVWIEQIEHDEGRLYVVLEPDGDLLGTAVIPPNSRVAAAERDRIWVLERDAYDVESVVRYAVIWQ